VSCHGTLKRAQSGPSQTAVNLARKFVAGPLRKGCVSDLLFVRVFEKFPAVE
jgi:hypothetical protein